MPSAIEVIEHRQRAVAKRNVELGWCPCGEELDGDCECGISRLGYVQGRGEPLKRSAEHPRIAPSEPREEKT
jgi:hypothetical protein